MGQVPSAASSTPASLQACRDYLAAKVFRFRPRDYHKRYPKWPGMVGLEVEMLPVRFAEGIGRVLPLYGPGSSSAYIAEAVEQGGLEGQLEAFEQEGQQKLLRVDLGLNDQLTFEPGGQVEFSSQPYPCLADACRRVTKVQQKLDKVFAAQGVSLVQLGANPWQSVEQIGLQMTKPRYQAMNKFFAGIGPFGQRMMRQTCSIQVNLDFGSDEKTLAQRYLLANLLAPLVTKLFAASPYRDGAADLRSNVRAEAWQKLDPSRTGFPKLGEVAEQMSLSSCVQAYLDFALDAYVAYVEALGYEVPDQSLRFREWLEQPYKGVSPTLADFEAHLSLLFPEIRPRGFLEIRSIDCLPRGYQFVPAMFYTSLLYNQGILEEALEALLPWLPDLERRWLDAESGFEDKNFTEKLDLICNLVLRGFSMLPECFQGACAFENLQEFIERYPKQRRTVSEDIKHALLTGQGQAWFRDGGIRS